MARPFRGRGISNLFIQLNLWGTKRALRKLFKTEKQLEKTAVAAKKTTKQVGKLSTSLSKLSRSATKAAKSLTESLLASVEKVGKSMVWLATKPFKMVNDSAKGLLSTLKEIGIHAAGSQLSNLISGSISGAKSFLAKGLGLAIEEQDIKFTLRETLGMQGRRDFLPKFLKALDRIQVKYGVDSTRLAKAFQGTQIPVNRLIRVAELVAKIRIQKPNLDPRIVATQLGQMIRRGTIEETIKDFVPTELFTMTQEEVQRRGLGLLEKQMQSIGKEFNRNFSFVMRMFNFNADETKRTFFRPVVRVLTDILRLWTDAGTFSLKETGTAVARTIKTAFNAFMSLFGDSDTGGLLKTFDKDLAFGIRFTGIMLKDIFDFLTGGKSLLQKILFPGNEKAGFFDLMKLVAIKILDKVTEFITFLREGKYLDAIGTAIGKAFDAIVDAILKGMGLDSAEVKKSLREFATEKIKDTKFSDIKFVDSLMRGTVMNLANDLINSLGEDTDKAKAKGDEKEKINDIRDRLKKLQDRDDSDARMKARLEEIMEIIGRGKSPATNDPSQKSDVPTDGDSGASVIINQDIRITTTQPAVAVRNALAAQSALISNMGRLA